MSLERVQAPVFTPDEIALGLDKQMAKSPARRLADSGLKVLADLWSSVEHSLLSIKHRAELIYLKAKKAQNGSIREAKRSHINLLTNKKDTLRKSHDRFFELHKVALDALTYHPDSSRIKRLKSAYKVKLATFQQRREHVDAMLTEVRKV